MRLILIAAFVSLSSVVWQHSQVQLRCLSARPVLTVPHTWQALLDGAHLSIFTTVEPALLATHSRMDTNSVNERSETFRPPQAFHPIKIEVFDADDGILAHKLVCQLKEPVPAAVADTLVYVLQIVNRPLAVVAAFLTAGYRTMGGSQFVERGFIPLGRIYHRAVIQVEKMLQTKVHPDSFTCSRKDVVAFLFRDNDEIELSQHIAFHCEGFNFAF